MKYNLRKLLVLILAAALCSLALALNNADLTVSIDESASSVVTASEQELQAQLEALGVLVT